MKAFFKKHFKLTLLLGLIFFAGLAKGQSLYLPIGVENDGVPYSAGLTVTDVVLVGQVSQRTYGTGTQDDYDAEYYSVNYTLGAPLGSNPLPPPTVGYINYWTDPSLMFPLNLSTATAVGTTPPINGYSFTPGTTTSSSYLNITNSSSSSQTIYLTQTSPFVGITGGKIAASDQYTIPAHSTKACYLRNLNWSVNLSLVGYNWSGGLQFYTVAISTLPL